MSELPPLYLITDRKQLAEARLLLKVLEELLEAGVTMLQLREKDLSGAELLPLARDIRELTKHYNCKLLINDRVDVAMAVDADGVHLGGNSVPPAVARELLGPNKLIGVSTHSVTDILTAERQGADFVTYGPVFYTPSKAAYGKPLGLDALKTACTHSKLPVYGLGGIKRENCSAVRNSGAHGVALISALLSAHSPFESCCRLLKILGS